MSLKKAKILKDQAFAALDRSKKGTTVRVDFNDLIDVCIAYEQCAEGDFEQLEYSNEVNFQVSRSLRRILDRISDLAPVDSEIWELCHAEYSPEFRIDPDACLRNAEEKLEQRLKEKGTTES